MMMVMMVVARMMIMLLGISLVSTDDDNAEKSKAKECSKNCTHSYLLEMVIYCLTLALFISNFNYLCESEHNCHRTVMEL